MAKTTPTMADARKEASGILFAIAALQILAGVIGLFVFPQLLGGPFADDQLVWVAAEWFGIAAVFVGLGAWARSQPLPPTVFGLVLYVGLSVAQFVMNPGPPPGLVMKVIITIGLIKAIRTCVAATPDDAGEAWDGSGEDDWNVRPSGKRHDPDHDGYS